MESHCPALHLGSSEHDFWRSILTINMNKPRSPSDIYVSENWKSGVKLAKTEGELTKFLTKEYEKKAAKFKKDYEKREKEELTRYQTNKGLVHKFILNPADINRTKSPFTLFQETFFKKASSNVSNSAEDAWSSLTQFERDVWAERLDDEESALENMYFHESILVTPNLLYIRNTIDENALSLNDARESWNGVTEESKSQLRILTIKENLEKDRLKDQFELRNGFSPSKPLDPFGLFFNDLLSSAKNKSNTKENISEGIKKWNMLDNAERSHYNIQHKVHQLRFDIKKEYLSSSESLELNKVTPFKLFVKDRSNISDINDIDFKNEEHIYKLKREWLGLPNCFKERYRVFSKNLNNTEQGIRDNSNDILSKSVKPLTAFSYFMKERLSAASNNSQSSTHETVKLSIENWKSLSEIERNKYEEIASKLREEFKSKYQVTDALPIDKAKVSKKTKTLSKTSNKEPKGLSSNNMPRLNSMQIRPKKKTSKADPEETKNEIEPTSKTSTKTSRSKRNKIVNS